MKIISHRGNLEGRSDTTENTIPAIDRCIEAGFDVEIDVQCVVGDHFFIGHDSTNATLRIMDYEKYMDRFWFHAKSMNALEGLMKFKEETNGAYDIFFHDRDFCALTKNGKLWIYPNRNLPLIKGKNSVAVLPEMVGLKPQDFVPSLPFYGVCTDFPMEYKNAAS